MIEWIDGQVHPWAALFSCAELVLVSLALGILIFKLIGVRFRHGSDLLLASLPLGLGAFSVLTLAAGSMRALSPVVCHAVCIPLALLGCFFIWGKGTLPSWRKAKRHILFLAPLVVMMLFSMGSAFCPPVGWDELTYHIALPLRWTQDSAPLVYADNPYSGFPGASDLLFWVSYLTGGITGPRLLVWFLFAWVANLLYRLVRPAFSPLKASIVVWSLLLAPLSFMVFKEAYSEPLLLLAFTAGLFICRRASRNTEHWRITLACGCLAGILLSMKLTGLFAAAGLFVMLPLWTRGWKKALLPALVFLAILLFWALPFYLRPYLATGNPLHPYFAWLFSAESSAVEASLFQHAIGSVKYGLHSLDGFFMNPLMIGFEEEVFDGSLGFQWLLLLVLALLALRGAFLKKGSLFQMTLPLFAAGILLYVLWFLTAQQVRFLMPLMPVVALLAVFGLKSIENPRLLALCLAALAALSFVSIPGKALVHHWQGWRVQFGLTRPGDYVYSGTGEGYLQAAEMSRRLVPKDGRLLLLFEERVLYFPKNSLIGTPFVQERFFTPPPKLSDGPQKVLETLRGNGISHVLLGLNPQHPDRLPAYLVQTEDFSKLLGSLIESGELRQLWAGPNYTLYAVK